jgi:hypothetical protein
MTHISITKLIICKTDLNLDESKDFAILGNAE